LTRKARDEPIRAHQQAPVVASLNLSPRPGDVASNLLMARHAHPALQWIVLPELFTSAYSSLAHVHHYAESATEGESARFFSALAHEQDLHIAYGFPEQLPIGGVSDSVNLVGPMKGGLEELTRAFLILSDPAAYRNHSAQRSRGRPLN